jgi:hypothetical protein
MLIDLKVLYGALRVLLMAENISDTEALGIARKHGVTCHTAKLTHQSFREAPKKITAADLKNMLP